VHAHGIEVARGRAIVLSDGVLIAVTVDGMVTPLQFKDERVRDTKLIPVMDKIKVVANTEFEALFPKYQPSQVTITTTEDQRVIKGNGLPLGVPTGTFPVQISDPAYQYDRNPNQVMPQNISFSIPRNPTTANSASCTYKEVGITLDGVQVHGPLDSTGRDELAHERLYEEGIPQRLRHDALDEAARRLDLPTPDNSDRHRD
jgi:hypothetical protein